MQQDWFDLSYIEHRHREWSSARDDCAVTRTAPRNPARRELLRKALLLGAAGSAPALAAAHTRIERTACGFMLSVGGEPVWSADVRWLVDPSCLAIRNEPGLVELSCPPITYPGTGIAAHFGFRLIERQGETCLRLRHALREAPLDIPLASWLAGSHQALLASASTVPLNLAVGKRMRVRRGGVLALAWMPNLGLEISGDKAVLVSGPQARGRLARCTLGPITDKGQQVRAARISAVGIPEGELVINPFERDRGQGELACDSFSAHRFELNVEEGHGGPSRATFLAQGSGGVRLERLALAGQPRLQLTGSTVSYAGTAAPRHDLLLASEVQASAAFDDAVLHGAAPPDDTLRVQRGGDTVAPSCQVRWDRILFREQDGISAVLRLRNGSDGDTAKQELGAAFDVLDHNPFVRHALSLDRAQIEFLRPADALWLRFQFNGFDLRRKLTGGFALHARGPAARMWLVLPPQAIAEQAFFEAPQWKPVTADNKDAFGIPFADKNDEARRGNPNPDLQVRKRQGDTPAAPDVNRIAIPSRARIAGNSALHFRLREGRGEELDLAIDALLDQSAWQLEVAPAAARDLDSEPHPASTPLTQSEMSRYTHIELPWRVHISPDETARLVTAPLRLTPGEPAQRLFYLSFRSAIRRGGAPVELPLRAIYSPDHGPALQPHFNPAAPTQADPWRTNLDAQDRNQLVWLSGRWNQAALPGSRDVLAAAAGTDGKRGIYVPQPFHAERLLLTSFGGSMRSYGAWDPPALYADQPPAGAPAKLLGLSIEEWTHRSTLARSHLDRVVYRGFLMPFGHRAVLTKVTERTFRLVDARLVAVPIQRYFVRITEKTKSFPAVGQPAASQHRFPQPEQFSIPLDGDLQIQEPHSTELNGEGPSAFVVCVKDPNTPYRFALQVGAEGRGEFFGAFVDTTVIHDGARLGAVVDAFNKLRVGGCANLMGNGSKVVFAPPRAHGDTSYAMHDCKVSVVVEASLVNSTLLEAARQAPFYPVIDEAVVDLPAIGRMLGKQSNTQRAVRYNAVYQESGFDSATAGQTDQREPAAARGRQLANPTELFLDLLAPADLSFTGAGDRSGGVVTPNLKATSISRSKGLVADPAVLPAAGCLAAPLAAAAAGTTSSSTTFANPFATDAKLLGILPLRFFFEAAGLGELPQLVDSIAYRIQAAGAELARQKQRFAEAVKTAAKDALAQVEADARFMASAAGAAIRSDLGDLVAQAEALLNAEEMVAILAAMQATATRLRALRDRFDTILDAPQLLLGPALQGLFTQAQAIEKTIPTLQQQVVLVGALANHVKAQLDAKVREKLIEVTGEVLRRYPRPLVAAARDRIGDYLDLAAAIERDATHFVVSFEQFAQAQLAVINRYRLLVEDGLAIERAIWAACRRPASQAAFVALRQQLQAIAASPALGALDAYRAAIELAEQCENYLREVVPESAVERFKRVQPHMAEIKRLLTAFVDARAPVVAGLEALNRVVLLLVEIDAVWSEMAEVAISGDPLHRFEECKRSLAELGKSLGPAATAVRQSLAPALEAVTKSLDQQASVTDKALHGYLDRMRGEASTVVSDLNGGSAPVLRALSLMVKVLDPRLARAPASLADLLAAAPVPADVLQSFDNLERAAALTATQAWDAARPLLDQVGKLAGELAKLDQGLLTAALGPQFKPLADSLAGHVTKLLQAADVHSFVWWDQAFGELPVIVDELNRVLRALGTVASQLPRAVAEAIRAQLIALVSELVPAKMTLDYSLVKTLDRPYGTMFLPEAEVGGAKQATQLRVTAKVESDLLQGTTAAHFEGNLSNFTINLFGVVKLPILKVAFRASPGAGIKVDPPAFGEPAMDGPLAFLKQLSDLMKSETGLFIEPSFSGIRAGYRFDKAFFVTGGMTIQNMLFETALEIPFDDRATVISFSMASKATPFLISVGVYGGGGFFRVALAGDRLVSIEASFEYGLVGAFDLAGVVRGSGRVTVGLYYRQSGSGTVLQGFFFAGGSARVLGIVSITAALLITVTYKNPGVSGRGNFRVTVGYGFFKWTLRYSVAYDQPRNRNLAVAGGAPDQEGAPDVEPDPLLDAQVWAEYQRAFCT